MRTAVALSELVANALAAAQNSGSLPPSGDAEVKIEIPQQAEHGDFSTSLPLRLARASRMAPLAIGEAIVAALPANDLVSRAWVARPGFINLELSRDFLRRQVTEIRSAGESYGASDAGVGAHVQVEFVSVNPTGPLHVGHTRGAVIGSGLANLLEVAGYKVQREYYVNDGGNQMHVFNETLYARFMQAAGRDVPLPDPAYPGEYLVELAAQLYEELGDALLSTPKESAIAELAPPALAATLELIRKDLEDLGVHYDLWFSEKSLIDDGQFDQAMSFMDERGYLANRDGAKWFLSTKLGEDKDNVVVRSDGGGPTYLGTDFAYHYNKYLVRGFDRVINVWGADHHGHVGRMKAVVKALGRDPDDLVIVINQIVSFKDGGQSVRFSKRKGVIVTVRELLNEVGADACRYIFLSRSPDSQMEFDLELARRQSSENPVFYVQYAHARIRSIQREAESRGLDYSDGDVACLDHPSEMQLVKKLIRLPDIIDHAAARLEPHHLPHYAYDVARSLQRFYEECRVVSNDPSELELSKARLLLVDAARLVLARTLGIMGMTAPDRM